MLEICTLSLTGPVLGMSEWCNAVILSSMTRLQLSSMSEVVVVVVVVCSTWDHKADSCPSVCMQLWQVVSVPSIMNGHALQLRDGHGHHSRHMPSYMAGKGPKWKTLSLANCYIVWRYTALGSTDHQPQSFASQLNLFFSLHCTHSWTCAITSTRTYVVHTCTQIDRLI